MKRKNRMAALFAAAVLSFPWSAPGESAAGRFTENEWNFVDQAMDIRGGIPEAASGVLGQIQRRGELRVAMDPETAPLFFLDSGKTGEDRFAGSDADLARRIAEKMGVSLRILPMETAQGLLALREDQCDLVISGVAYTPARALNYTLSSAYWTPETGETIGLIVRDDREITSLQDLDGAVLAVRSNSLAETLGVRQIRNYLEFRRLSSARQVFETVEKGEADAGLVSVTTAEGYLRTHPGCGIRLAENLVFTPDEVYQGYRAAARKGETQLICFVNGVIQEIREGSLYGTWLTENSRRAAELGL